MGLLAIARAALAAITGGEQIFQNVQEKQKTDAQEAQGEQNANAKGTADALKEVAAADAAARTTDVTKRVQSTWERP